MNVEHLNQVDHNVLVIQLLVKQVELHEEVQHVDDVEKDFQNEWVILNVAVVNQELNAS